MGSDGEQLSTGRGIFPWGTGGTIPGYGGGGVRLTANSPLLGLAGCELGGVGGMKTFGTTCEADDVETPAGDGDDEKLPGNGDLN